MVTSLIAISTTVFLTFLTLSFVEKLSTRRQKKKKSFIGTEQGHQHPTVVSFR